MGNSRPLEEYRRKRDPAKTPEPMGRGGRATPRRRFVIQKHRARRLHYDFRLEMDGVLKSWAVPKGPSVDPDIKRLAVHVEDHPLAYATFEGVIPKGSYGAGTVIVWDQGTYRLVGSKPQAEQLDDGHLEIDLHGSKLRGRWLLVRTRPRDPRQWLLVKRDDAYARGPEPIETRPESVRSGVRLEQTTTDPLAGLSGPLPRARLEHTALPFMLPTLTATPPDGPGWVFEIKWDGIRVLILRRAGTVRLMTRGGLDFGPYFPEIVAAATRLAGDDFALDAEVVALDRDGRPNFHLLRRRTTRRQRGVASVPVIAHAYDCVALGGRDLRRRTLEERKAILQQILGTDGALRYCEHVDGDGAAILESVRELGLEGIVAKQAEAPYRGGRRREWLKIKCDRVEEFVIGGYTDPKGSRAHLGALHLGVYVHDQLTYVGRVGSGLGGAALRDLREALATIGRQRAPFKAGEPPSGHEHHWVRPLLVCDVRFIEWTPDGHLRHPVFVRPRPDRDAAAVRRESPLRRLTDAP